MVSISAVVSRITGAVWGVKPDLTVLPRGTLLVDAVPPSSTPSPSADSTLPLARFRAWTTMSIFSKTLPPSSSWVLQAPPSTEADPADFEPAPTPSPPTPTVATTPLGHFGSWNYMPSFAHILAFPKPASQSVETAIGRDQNAPDAIGKEGPSPSLSLSLLAPSPVAPLTPSPTGDIGKEAATVPPSPSAFSLGPLKPSPSGDIGKEAPPLSPSLGRSLLETSRRRPKPSPSSSSSSTPPLAPSPLAPSPLAHSPLAPLSPSKKPSPAAKQVDAGTGEAPSLYEPLTSRRRRAASTSLSPGPTPSKTPSPAQEQADIGNGEASSPSPLLRHSLIETSRRRRAPGGKPAPIDNTAAERIGLKSSIKRNTTKKSVRFAADDVLVETMSYEVDRVEDLLYKVLDEMEEDFSLL